MTASGWLAIGSIVASLAAPQVGSVVVALAATSLALTAIALRGLERPSLLDVARRGAPLAVGATLVALRLLSIPSSDATPVTLPDGRGPWMATVESISPVRDGQQVATLLIGIPGGATSARILVAATLPRYPTIEPGQRLTVDGAIEAPPDGAYGDYLHRIGVAGTLRSRSLGVMSVATEPLTLERLRRGAGAALAAAIPEPEAGLAEGIVIGLRDRVDRDLAADFTTVGASHVVAISGWNIAIVAATVAALAGRLGRRRRSLLLTIAIVAYVLFAGASPSVVRAAAMAGVVLLARETGRAGRAAAALGWAAALLLIADPSLVSDPGFQLSSLATGGILAWANGLQAGLGRLAGGRLPGWLAESLAVSLAAQAATLPVVLLVFGRLAIISPAINLLIVPLVAPAMGAALIALVGGIATLAGAPAFIATLAGLPAWALLTAMCTIIRGGAALPFASVTLGPPWTIVAATLAASTPFAAIAMVHAWRRRSARTLTPRTTVGAARRTSGGRPIARSTRVAAISLAVAVGALGLAFAHRSDGSTRITVLDVGQGDSILVEGGRGARMLIDGGPDPDRLLIELDRRLPPWDRRIDILVLTHPHEDHVAGLAILLERYRIGRIYETGMRGPGPGYGAFARDLAKRGAPPDATLAAGARIALDDLRFRVLWPDPGRVPREPPDAGRGINDVSVVLLGEVAGRRMLLTGDVEDDVDPVLAARGLPPIDILKVAHHGSATASTPAFLDAVRPKVAIVSAGAGNPYGHPARSTIDRLRGTGARVLRTDTDGSVEVTIDPAGQIAVSSSGARRVATGFPVVDTIASDSARLPAARGQKAAAQLATGQPLDRARPIVLAPRTFAFACGIPSNG